MGRRPSLKLVKEEGGRDFISEISENERGRDFMPENSEDEEGISCLKTTRMRKGFHV